MMESRLCLCGCFGLSDLGRLGHWVNQSLRVEVGDSGILASREGNEFAACTFDDGEGDGVSRHCSILVIALGEANRTRRMNTY
jgi:hypothetical protein